MLQLENTTPFAAMLMLMPDADGIDTLYAVVRATYVIDGPPEAPLSVADPQPAVVLADEHYGDPGVSSIRAPTDVGLGKPGTDVVLIGSAWAPDGKATWQLDVTVSLGPVSKTVRVFGDRVWDAGAGGVIPTWVSPFLRMPLVWERAFGGRDEGDRGPASDPRNPVGVGFRARGSSAPVRGVPLPNIEDPAALMSSPTDTPTPAGFAPVAPHWEPRVSYAGTYDAAWQEGRAPYLPADFDRRFFHMAPAGLSTSVPLMGGEPVGLTGLTPTGALRFTLPTARPRVTYRLPTGRADRPVMLETVLIEPDAGHIAMVWRAAFACDKRALRVQAVEIALAATD